MKRSSRLRHESASAGFGRETVSVLGKVGYEFDRQRGSRIILRQTASPFRRIVVHDHKTVAKGTLRSILRETGLTIEEFNILL